MKAMYLLTDVEGHDNGNLTVFQAATCDRFPRRRTVGLPRIHLAQRNWKVKPAIVICSRTRCGTVPRPTGGPGSQDHPV